MTLREIRNTINGFEKFKDEEYEVYLMGIRRICFHVNRVMFVKKPFRKEEQVFPLKMDKKIRQMKARRMKPIEGKRKK